jgi:RNA polymerase sigma factor (sigma-70 family)
MTQVRRAAELGRRLRIPEHTAEELLQECLLRLWQEQATVDRARWEGWMWKAMHLRRLHCLRAARRAAKFEQRSAYEHHSPHESGQPDVGLYLAQCERDLCALAAGLPAVRREVARLYLLEELPMADVAVQLGIPENTAKDQWRLAQIDMRATWERDRARERSTLRLAAFFGKSARLP